MNEKVESLIEYGKLRKISAIEEIGYFLVVILLYYHCNNHIAAYILLIVHIFSLLQNGYTLAKICVEIEKQILSG